MSNSKTSSLLVALVISQVLEAIVPAIDENLDSYKTRVKAWVARLATIYQTRWRIFGIRIRIRFGVRKEDREYICTLIDGITTDTIDGFIADLTSKYVDA